MNSFADSSQYEVAKSAITLFRHQKWGDHPLTEKQYQHVFHSLSKLRSLQSKTRRIRTLHWRRYQHLSLTTQTELIEYRNAKTELHAHFNHQANYQHSREQLLNAIQTAPVPLRALRTLAKEVRTHCLRDQHQIKEELTTIEQTTVCSTPEMKRRLVDTLISVEVPGMEAHTLLKKKDTPPRLLHFSSKN